MQHDTVKARVLQPDGTYCKKPAVPDPVCAQALLMQQAISEAHQQSANPAPPTPGWKKFLHHLFGGED